MEKVEKKLEKLKANPKSGHRLHGSMAGDWAIHVNPYVITYHIDEESKVIVPIRFQHHDEAYV